MGRSTPRSSRARVPGSNRRRARRLPLTHRFRQTRLGATLASPLLALLLAATTVGMVAAAQFPRPRTLDVGSATDSSVVRSFHDREREPGTTFRWTSSASSLVFPGAPGNSAWRATLRLSGTRPPGTAPPAFDILVDGRLVGHFQAVPEFHDYAVAFSRVPLAPGNLTITIRSATFRPPGDARDLGVQVESVTLEPLGPATRLPFYFPPPSSAGLVLLSVVLSAAALGQLMSRRVALGGAGIIAIGLVAAPFVAPERAARYLPGAPLAALALLSVGAVRAVIHSRERPSRGEITTPHTRRSLVGILIGGAVLRLALTPFGSYVYDAETQRRWAARLLSVPLRDFYLGTPLIDHLPGDMWLLWLVAHVYAIVAPGATLTGTSFVVALKLVPVLADVISGWLVYLAARTLAPDRVALLGVVAWLLNPAALFVTVIWGQWDAVPALLVLGAVWLALEGVPLWGLPLLAYAALIKPQLLALAPLLLLAALARQIAAAGGGPVAWGRLLRQAVAPTGVALLMVLLVPLPFAVALPPLPARWSLVGRAVDALNNYRYTSYSAFNLWTTPVATTSAGATFKLPDATPWLFGWSYATWSAGLLVLVYGAILGRYWLARGDAALIWAALAILTALFVLPTRVHERYLLPAVLMGALAAAVAPRTRPIYAALSAILFANLYYVYAQFFAPPALRFSWVYSAPFVSAWSTLATVTLVALVVAGPRWLMAGATPTRIGIAAPAATTPNAVAGATVDTGRRPDRNPVTALVTSRIRRSRPRSRE